ncbi:MAG TPA: RNA methyltransferase [Mucilaginibacter sp.]
MLSKSQISLLKSLQQKKERVEHGLFLVEGYKSITEFINSSYQVEALYHTAQFSPKVLKLSQKINIGEISVTEMEKISSLKTPQEIVALVKIPNWPPLNHATLKQKFSIVLDGIQDPGNLGTIVRIADWFGIKNIICSADTVDAYNPKVVQATMGSLSRINIYYTNIAAILTQVGLPIFGAMLKGENIYKADFGDEGLVVLGNEGNGLRPEIEKLIGKAVTIPSKGEAESLNVAVAAALFCSEINRKSYK